MSRKKEKKIFMLSKRHEDILKAVYFYRFVTALDITNLLYSHASVAYVRQLLSELAGGADYKKNEYLYRFPLEAGVGNRVRVYTLGNRGRDLLRNEMEVPITWYFRPDKVRHLSFG